MTNVEAEPNRDAARIPALLAEQVTAPVRFVECVRRLVALGVTRVIEVGPGGVLCGLVARIERGLERERVGSLAELRGARGRRLESLRGGDMSLERRVQEIIVEQLGVSAEEAVPQASFIDDLGADSLDIVELVMAMEEEFDVEIPDEDAEKIQTIGGAIQYLKDKLEAT